MKELESLIQKFERIAKEVPEFEEKVIRESALAFLGNVIPVTPTGQNYKYKQQGKWRYTGGGALKRGWVDASLKKPKDNINYPEPTNQEMHNRAYSEALNNNSITISNNVYYAPYVNYGHRFKQGQYVPSLQAKENQGTDEWGATIKTAAIDGIHFLETAEHDTELDIPKIINKVWKEYVNTWNKT